MYIEVDREKLLILRKMQHQVTLSRLSSLEHPDRHVVITTADVTGPCSFTDLELKMLIKNAAGPDVRHVFSRTSLQEILTSMIKTLPEFEANGFEVDLQLRSIPEGDADPYIYVRGAFKPEPAPEGLDYIALQYAGSALNVPASAPQHAPQGTVAPAAPQAPAVQPRPESTDDFAQPKPGTSTHEIFTFCAQEWQAAGCPQDERLLTEIRKRALDQLTARGINASTVRTQAMRWYHNRTRFAG